MDPKPFKILGVIWCYLMFPPNLVHVQGACTFPTEMQNKQMTSTYSDFDSMSFGTDTVNFTVSAISVNSWLCHEDTGSLMLLRSVDSKNVLQETAYYYYCLSYTKVTNESFLFYIRSRSDTYNTGYLQVTVSSTLTTADACTEPVSTAKYYTLVNTASIASSKDTCATILLASFSYACASNATKTSQMSVCSTTNYQTGIEVDDTNCNDTSILDTGSYYCVAETSESASDGLTYYYQMVYNPFTTTFKCLTVSSNDSAATVMLQSGSSTACTAGPLTSWEYALATDTIVTVTEAPATQTTESSNSGVTIGIIIAAVLFLLLIIGALLFYFCVYKRDPNAGKPIVENTKPRFEDPDKEDELIDMEVDTARSTPLTRDEITFDAVSPSIISNGKIGNGHAKSLSPDGLFSTHNTSSMQDSGIALTDKSIGERPTPRIGINPSKESMVIFNGDQKVISGNDTRIVPNTNPNPRVFHMENFIRGEGPLTIEGLDEEDDSVGELTSRENYPYPSLPREKSNLMPPIETSDPEKNKDKS
ncbi:uncharacterized protein LOC128223272 [Mya arenaria]|uniref:uncharacterized protein LOC128223272 n=1 Tax=Mya arenaria TaxID=6604 RepID=UPI0022E68B6D|nr:uncharacterized protein LOC128223272 [Mya arenaria]